MKKYFKTIFYCIGSLLFLTLTIMFTINVSFEISIWEPFFSSYYIIFITCLVFITILFAIKAIEHLIKDTPLRDKLTVRKQARNEAKAEKAEADKQAKIEKLEAELQALKKDSE